MRSSVSPPGRAHLRFNRWRWEPLFFLLPILLAAPALGFVLFIMFGETWSRIVGILLVAFLVAAYIFRLLRRIPRERSP